MIPHGHGISPRLLAAGDGAPRLSRELLKRVLSYGMPYLKKIFALLFLILVAAGLNLITPLILRDMIDHTIPAGNVRRLGFLGFALLLVPMLNGVISVLQRKLNASVGEGVIHDLRIALYGHLQRMSLRFFTHTRVGELMSRLNSDVIGAHNAISNTIVDIVTSLIQTVAVLTVLLFLEWRLALLSVVILPLFFVLARPLSSRLREISRGQMEANARMNAMMNETLGVGGALLVKLFGRQNEELGRFRTRAEKVRDLGINRAVMGSFAVMAIGLVSAVGTALIYGIGGYLVIRGTFTVGTIVAFTAYLTTLYGALRSLANAPVEFAASMVSFERVFEVIDLPTEIQERADPVVLSDVKGELVFDQVTFSYDSEDRFLLKDVRRYGRMMDVGAALSDKKPVHGNGDMGPAHAHIDPAIDPGARFDSGAGADAPRDQAREHALYKVSFKVRPGQLVALVGPSGAGKTTLTYLIPRLYDLSGGRILIDGHDVRDVSLQSLGEQVGMVTQETHLFHDTIRTNLLYAKLEAGQSELEAAARAANIHHFITNLEEGYDTIVGERGYRLSGGEKQRIALARVILKNPRILILDEATSHLDSESEALIQESLKKVMAGRTSIVIAHRLSTILAADQVLVFDRGRIVEQGSHKDLLAVNGLYAHLYETQLAHSMSEGLCGNEGTGA